MLADELVDEVDRVYRWRRDKFLELGFSWLEARMLADAGADYHQAERLLDVGCPRHLVFDLLS